MFQSFWNIQSFCEKEIDKSTRTKRRKRVKICIPEFLFCVYVCVCIESDRVNSTGAQSPIPSSIVT